MNVHMLLLNCNTLHKYRALHSIEKLFIMSNNNNKCYYTISYIHFSQNKMQSQKEFSFKTNKNLTKFFSSTESINALCIHNMLQKFNRIKTLWIAMIIIVFFFYFSLYMVHNSLQFFALFFVWFVSFVDLS